MAGIVGLVLHALVGSVQLVTTALVVPTWAAIVFGLWWMAFAGVAINTFRRKPLLTPVVPLIAVIMWGGVVAVGELMLIWNI